MCHLNLCLLFGLVTLCASGSLNKEKSNELLCLYTGKFSDEIEKLYIENNFKDETRYPDEYLHISPLQMDGFTQNQYPFKVSFKDSEGEFHKIYVAEIKNDEVIYYIYQMNYNSTLNNETNGAVKEKIDINKYPIAWKFTEFSNGQFKGGSAPPSYWHVYIVPSGKVIFQIGFESAEYIMVEFTKKERFKEREVIKEFYLEKEENKTIIKGLHSSFLDTEI